MPILVDEASSIFSVSSIATAEGTLTAHRGLRRLIPSISLNLAGASNLGHLDDLLKEREPPVRVLVIGAGEGGAGTERLDSQYIEQVLSDIAIGPGTDICFDAHTIPFPSDTFDAVVVQAVLEHVLEPMTCVREIKRVLKPHGLVYAETPFMQQVHMGAYDFTRFTPLGHRRLFRDFEELRSGMAVGPGSALAWSLTYFVVSFARGRTARRLLNATARLAFFWLKYFDRIVQSNDSALDGACGVFFLGRLSKVTLTDRELIQGYRGGF